MRIDSVEIKINPDTFLPEAHIAFIIEGNDFDEVALKHPKEMHHAIGEFITERLSQGE